MTVPGVVRHQGRHVAWIALPLLTVIVALAVVFFPGRMVPDTIDMCNQALTERYHDWHSPVLAGMWGFFDVNLGVLFVVQIAVFVTAVGVILLRWLKSVPALVATAIISWSPVTLGWLSHVGKDEWFAVSALVMVAAMGRADASSRPSRTVHLAAVVGAAWFAIASRPNAVVPVFGALAVFTWSARVGSGEVPRERSPLRRLVNPAAAAAITLVLVTSVQLVSSVVVQPAHVHPEHATMLFDLAGMSERTGHLLIPASVLKPGTSVADVAQAFDVTQGEAFVFSADFPFRSTILDPVANADLDRAWVDAIRDHPVTYLKVRAAYIRAQLGMSRPHPFGSINDPGSAPETFGYSCPVPGAIAPGVRARVDHLLARVADTNLIRGWVFLLLAVAGAAAAGLRRCVEARALVAMALLHELTIMVAGMTPTFRFSWFIAVAAQINVALLLSRTQRFGRRSASAGLAVRAGDE